ncbi:thiopeptide-type bacteriocin biosynthesis protein [Flavobacterium sp. MR2016-29]|uniref:thiopeptide-type bacteriocin biosynthesis protein n=1 Tax=Flavobacterium sp. MR2016-29 TaxID=2783795 RepID=UPI001889CA34|nr:thiopeptide-type bacteriocin biosynthesis protein [Flavobacterium sp. MR2016-29]MBF4494635.1 thiopeptide-type bacteriocin biosynthesis protein [Flavobacterium sp. MR2016-29]
MTFAISSYYHFTKNKSIMQRDFSLGSQWLYYKIYTGVKTADTILLEKLEPIIAHLEQKKKIQKWFFIRYHDPKEHIRLRFLVDDTDNLAIIINSFQSVFKELMTENLVWKIQTDTYQREIERYGKETMYASEFLFWKDSKMILQYLSIKDSFSEKEMPLFFSFLAVDSFLNSFKLSSLEKLSLMSELQVAYKKEFEVDKVQKKQLDLKYRSLAPQIKQFLEGSIQNDFSEMYEVVNQKADKIRKTALEIRTKIEIPLNDFLASHVHMMINRQYTSKQRIYELVIYDHLYRYYKTLSYTQQD